jgi:hypothetical protein
MPVLGASQLLSPSDAKAAIAPGGTGEWIKVKNRAHPAIERDAHRFEQAHRFGITVTT